jgi:hypothetical protein
MYMYIDVNETSYSFYYSPMHAGNASLMVRAGACAYSNPLACMYVFLLFLQSHHFDTSTDRIKQPYHTIERDEDPRPRLSGSMVLHLGLVQVGLRISAA